MIILFYVMDCLRSDFLSCYGHPRETSPRLDALAREGVLFKNSFAQSTWTRPSGASIITGTYPSVHGVNSLRDRLSDKAVTIPALMKQHGFMTIGVSAMPNISPEFGFANGFDVFVELYKNRELTEKRERLMLGEDGMQAALNLERNELPVVTSEDINDHLIPLIRENSHRDLFIFVWSLDTHDPYFQRDRALARFSRPVDKPLGGKGVHAMKSEAELDILRGLYEDMIYYNDHHFGALIDDMKDLGLYDSSLVIVTGDHGEAFGEHGMNSHAGLPFDEQIRVPLVMKFPETKYGGTVVEGFVQHIDIAPTIFDFIGQGQESNLLQGVSVLPLLSGKDAVNDFVFAEMEQYYFGFHRYVAMRTKEYKYIDFFPARNKPPVSAKSVMVRVGRFVRDGRIKRMLFNLRNDPMERENIFQKERAEGEHFGREVRRILEANKKFAERAQYEAPKKVEIDDDTAKQLKALGYFE